MATLAMVFGAAIAVRGAATCPTAAAVAEALAAISPPDGTPATGDWADIAPDGDSIRVRLLQSDGTLLAEKRLAPGPCRQQAQTAAVVLAAWVSQLRSGVAFSFEAPPRAPTVAERGPPTLSAVAAPPDRDRLVVAAGAGLLASLQSDSLAPAAAIEARVHGRRSGWGGRLALRAAGTHRVAFGPGDAAWRRLSVAAGVLHRRVWGRVSGEAGIDLLTGALLVEGDGYTVPRSTRSWDFGAEAGARAGLVFGRFEPWLGFGLSWWLRPQIVQVTGISGEERLPPLEARIGAGVNIVWDP